MRGIQLINGLGRENEQVTVFPGKMATFRIFLGMV